VNGPNSLNDGWVEDVSDVIGMDTAIIGNQRRNALEAMSDHLKQAREVVRNHKKGKTELEHGRCEKQSKSVETDVDEASDVVTSLPESTREGVKTRSLGPVQTHPYVQGVFWNIYSVETVVNS
jgi:hypothetical protein